MSEGKSGRPAASERRPYGGAADARTEELSLTERFRRHADALVRDARSPLSSTLMYAAADDLEAGGAVARLFEPVSTPPGSVPQLRLLGALHHLVLDGQAPELAAYYPSAGGAQGAAGVWRRAEAVIELHFDWIQARLSRTVQTNEPGRSTVLYPGLLWLSEQHGLPIRLLEIGASAGLNLLADRYCYLTGGVELGDSGSAVRFQDPWQPPPPGDLRASAARLKLTARAGCDRHPLDPSNPQDRTTLLSYIWPDEVERFARSVAALEVAARAPAPIERAEASHWLPRALEARQKDELTVIWQSVFRQYVAPAEWRAIEHAVRGAIAAHPDARLAWLTMEPGEDHLAHMKLSLREHPDEHEQLLAWCGDHGPPVKWVA